MTASPRPTRSPQPATSQIVGDTAATSADAIARAELSDELVEHEVAPAPHPSFRPTCEPPDAICLPNATTRPSNCFAPSNVSVVFAGTSNRFSTIGWSLRATRTSVDSGIKTNAGGAGESGSGERMSCTQLDQYAPQQSASSAR